MSKGWIRLIITALILTNCRNDKPADGLAVENQILLDNHLGKDFSDAKLFEGIIKDVNCADSAVLGKSLVLAKNFHSWDSSEILLIPFISNGTTFKSSAYSDITNRFVLINPSYIREFTLKNTLNDTTSYTPVLELMLLHEISHFILKKSGAFDKIENTSGAVGESQTDDTQPQYITTIKKTELSADSLAIDLIKRKLSSRDYSCLNIAFDIQRIVPGMQFQLSGRRMIENFGNNHIDFLRDPGNDHPNLELRITFMNYFLYPNDPLKQMIDNYLYNRTIAPVHRQEFDPRIFQGQEKKLPAQ